MSRFQTIFVILSTLGLGSALYGQNFEESDLFVADRGSMSNGSDGEIRQYTHTGLLLATLTNSGSGQIRGLACANNGALYVARGDDILRYTAPNFSPDTAAFATGSRAQDVAVNESTGEIWCAFGNTTTNSSIEVFDANGLLLRTITDAAISHPRSIDWNFAGDVLFVANQSSGNVLAVNEATGTVTVHTNVDSSFSGFRPVGISVARNADDVMYVSGDFGGATQIVEVVGPAGSATTTSFVNFGSLADLTAPAGTITDNYGNVYFASRDKNMGVPGVYCYTRQNGLRTVLPYVGSEHISPIDIAFRKRIFEFNLTSSDGVTAAGQPRVLGGTHNAQIVMNLQAPDYVGMPFAIFYSLMLPSICQNSDPLRPVGGGVPIERPDTRSLPLLFDSVLGQSIALVQQGGIGAPVIIDPSVCPNSTFGFFLHPQGVIDPNGNAVAVLTFPSLPCLGPGIEVYMAFAAVVIDGVTQPLLVGLATSRLHCLVLEG